MRVVVDSRIRVQREQLTDEQVEALKRGFTHANPTRAKMQRINKWAAAREPKYIATWEYDRATGFFSIPRGGLGRLRDAIRGTGYEVEDRRVVGTGPPVTAEHGVELWGFQEVVADAAIAKQNCLIRSPTGSGKTSAAIAIAARAGLPTLVVVWTGTLFDQWINRLRSELGMRDAEIGRIRAAERRVGAVTVGMLQTLSKCVDDYSDVFGTVIADEVHRFAAPSFMRVIDRLPAKYRIGVSDDERRNDGKEFLIYDVFGDVAANVDRAMLVDEGYVKDVRVDVVTSGFERDWWTALPGPEKPRCYKRLIDEMGLDDERNAVVVDATMRYAADHQVFVFCHRREHCHRIEHMLQGRGVPVGLMIGGADYQKQFDAALRGMRSRELRVAVGTYKAIGTGLDVPHVSRGVCATPIHSDQYGFRQVRGRLCRTTEGKVDAAIAVVWDRAIFPRTPLANMVRWNRVVRVVSDGIEEDGKAFLQRIEDSDDVAERDAVGSR